MKLISPEEITKAVNKVYPSGTEAYSVNVADKAIAQVQLDSCEKECDKLVELDPDQSLPECPYSYKGWTQYEESICKNAYQQMKDEGWVKMLKEKDDG